MILSKVYSGFFLKQNLSVSPEIRPSTNQINSEYGARHQVSRPVELSLTQIYKNIKEMYAEIYILHLRVQRFASFQSCLLEL